LPCDISENAYAADARVHHLLSIVDAPAVSEHAAGDDVNEDVADNTASAEPTFGSVNDVAQEDHSTQQASFPDTPGADETGINGHVEHDARDDELSFGAEAIQEDSSSQGNNGMGALNFLQEDELVPGPQVSCLERLDTCSKQMA
jgi:hypothetical protein